MSEKQAVESITAKVFRGIVWWFVWHLFAVGVMPAIYPEAYEGTIAYKFGKYGHCALGVGVALALCVACNRSKALAIGAFIYACFLAFLMSVANHMSTYILYSGFIALAVIYSAVMWRSDIDW